MNFKLFGIITTLLLAFCLTGCSETTNENANINKNMNANTAVANENVNTNANANTKQAPTQVNLNLGALFLAAHRAMNANANRKQSPTRADYEKNKQTYSEEAKNMGRKIGTGLDDGWLWTKTRFDLAAADDLRDSTINVDVENAVVTLSGTVASAEQKAKAEAVAKAVAGVKSVKNLLKVAANTNSNTANSNTKKKY